MLRSAADRYNLLSDSDFVYDWNKAGANPFANRKSFPALVGAGAAVAYAEMARKIQWSRIKIYETKLYI